jgi:hypothetical protein
LKRRLPAEGAVSSEAIVGVEGGGGVGAFVFVAVAGGVGPGLEQGCG